MGTSGHHEFFLEDLAGAGPTSGRAAGPHQSMVVSLAGAPSGGPHQAGTLAQVVVNAALGPHQTASPLAIDQNSTGPYQATTALAVDTNSMGPHQNTIEPITILGADGECSGRAAGGRAHTVPGGLGVAVEGVEAGERPTLNMVSSRSIRWGSAQLAGGVSQIVPLVDGVIDITDRLAIDATLAAFDTDLKALWSWGPDGAANPRRLFVTEIWVRPTAIAVLTSAPIFNLGDNGPAFDSTKLGMDMAGATVGSWRVFRVLDNVAAYFEDTTPGALTLRLATPAVATTYDVDVVVRGYHTRAALQDN